MIRILRGQPTPEEIAAVVVALELLAREPRPAPPALAWRRAARLEGLGGAPLRSADDPRLRATRP